MQKKGVLALNKHECMDGGIMQTKFSFLDIVIPRMLSQKRATVGKKFLKRLFSLSQNEYLMKYRP